MFLSLQATLDEEAKFAILYAPSVDLDESTVEKISKWLDNDGKYGRNLIFIPTENNVDTPNIDSLLNEWGMQVNPGYVYETSTDRLVSNSSPYIFTVDYTDYYTTGLKILIPCCNTLCKKRYTFGFKRFTRTSYNIYISRYLPDRRR